MKKILITLSAALALVSFVVLEAGSWSLDAGHSRLGFTVKHMEISETVGQFDKFDVKITTPNADFSDATIELTAEAKTVNTYLSMRDDHLRSADFFDVEKHPTITFKSTSVKKAKGNNYVIHFIYSLGLRSLNFGILRSDNFSICRYLGNNWKENHLALVGL